MSYLLFYNPDSANIVVRMALEELGVDYRDELVDRRRTNRSEAFLRLNPRGLLPLLVDEEAGVTASETGAILLYLADTHGSLAPADGADKATFLKWLFYLSNTVHADLRLQFYTARYVGDETHIETLRARMRERFGEHMALVENALGEHDRPYLMASGLSVADFYLAACVRWAQLYPSSGPVEPWVLDGLPRLTACLDELERLPSVVRAFDREGIAAPLFVKPTEALPPRA